jgi:hypothetical protein
MRAWHSLQVLPSPVLAQESEPGPARAQVLAPVPVPVPVWVLAQVPASGRESERASGQEPERA